MKNNTALYKWLIITFIALYAGTAFVSFYHSITFFNIANSVWLSVILSLIAEIGQASVLFSLLLTKNKNNALAWTVMFLLTALQIVGNVVSSYKYISVSSSIDFTYFQKSILFWVSNTNETTFKVIIAWITGGILPIIALSMTALVADNLKLREEESENSTPVLDETPVSVVDDKVDEIKEVDGELFDIDSGIDSTNETMTDAAKNKSKREKPKSNVKKQAKRKSVPTKQVKIKPVKDLSSLKTLSKGSELIQTLQSDSSIYDKVPIEKEKINDQTMSEARSDNNDGNVISTILKNGVVVDKNFR